MSAALHIHVGHVLICSTHLSESFMNGGDYIKARAAYVEAATGYRLATGRGEIKQQVASAKEASISVAVRSRAWALKSLSSTRLADR